MATKNFVTTLIFSSASLASFVQAGERTESVEEPNSGFVFPVELAVSADRPAQHLAGTGIRTKTFLKLQVYAIGLYVETKTAAVSLSPWRGLSRENLEENEAFYREFLSDGFAKSLRLVLTRDVSGEQMATDFDDSLKPRFKHAIQQLGLQGAERDLDSFREFFDLEMLAKETVLVFSWLPGGTLLTQVNGHASGKLASPALCWALFDAHLGDKPISERLKRTVIARIPSILGTR